MFESPDILTLAHKQPVMVEETGYITGKVISRFPEPGSIAYAVTGKIHHWVMEDTGMLFTISKRRARFYAI